MIYHGNLELLKKTIMKNTIIGLFLCFIFFVLFFYSFKLLSNEKYSFIPIGDVLALTFMIILVILVIFWTLEIITPKKAIEKRIFN